MNEQNFDKILSQKMAEERDFPFEEGKWDKMEKKLDDFHAQKRYYRLLWAMALSLVGLMGLWLYSNQQLAQTKSIVHDLTQAVQHLRSEKQVIDSTYKGTIIQKDTMYQHIIVRRYDTIFQTIVQRTLSDIDLKNNRPIEKQAKDNTKLSSETVSNKIDTNQTNSTLNKPEIRNPKSEIEDPLSISAKDNTKLSSETVSNKIDTNQTNGTLNKPENRNPKSEIESVSVKDSSKLSSETVSNKIDTNQTNSTLNKPEIGNRKSEIEDPLSISNENLAEKKKPIIKPIKIKGFEVGVMTGAALISNYDIKQQMNYTAGIRGSIGLGERLKIVAETQYLGLNYKIDSFSRRMDIPIVSPPTSNDALLFTKVNQKTWQFSLGMRYDLLRGRVRPYIGVGVVGNLESEEQFNFRFINSVTQREVSIGTKNRRNDAFDSFLRLNTGLTYPISTKLNLQIEGSYDAPFAHKHDYKPAIWQLKGAVLYRF